MANNKKTPKKNNSNKSPKEMPSLVNTEEEYGPKVSPDDNASKVQDANRIAPTQSPPAEIAEVTAEFAAGTWERDKRVSALYNTHHSRNAWMHIVGKGWVRLATTNESSCEAMNILAAHAKLKNTRIDYYVEGGKVTQMYIW